MAATMTLTRAVVTDDGLRIVLSFYDGLNAYPYELTPVEALTVAHDLLSVALHRLRRAPAGKVS